MTTMTHINKEQVAATVKQFITEAFLYDRTNVMLAPDFQLITQGVIDSMGIFRLITFLEKEFNITIEPTEIEFENFATIEAIATLIAGKSLV